MKTYLTYLTGLALLSILLLPYFLFPVSKPGISQLESRLASTTGEKRLTLLLELTRACAELEPQKALTYGKESLELLERFLDPELQVDILNILCEVCNSLGKYDLSRKYALQTGEIAEKTGYKKGYADSLFYLGRINYYQGIYDEAAKYLSQAQELYEEIDSQTGLAQTLNAFGLVYWRLGDFSRALENILESCKIRENQKGKTEEADRDIAYSYNNIGLIYVEIGDHEKSRAYLLEARKIHESIDNKTGIAIALNNIAAIYREERKYTKALDYYKQSLKINEEMGFKHGAAITLNNIGKVYEEMENYQYALHYLLKGLKISKEINQQNIISNTLIYIGRIKRKMGQYQEALQLVNEALDIASRINVIEEIRDANKELAEIYAAQKDFPKTLDYLKKYKEINQLIFNETSSIEMTEMQSRFELEKKEKEIALLKKNHAIHQLILKRQRIFNYFIIIASVLVSIVGFVIYTRYRLKLKMTRALSKEIEEHKQTTQKLQESEEKFKILAESAVVGIYILQDSVITYVNPKLLTILACPGDEMIGQGPLKWVFAEDHPLVREKIKQRLTGTDRSVRYEFRGITGNGEILQLECYGGLIHYQGQPAVLEMVIDITNKKKTAEKLLKSKKLEAMGILAGGIAHDFNNLLAVLVGYLDMVKDHLQTNTPAYHLVTNIENNYNQAVNLGQKLASFAKGSWTIPQEVTLNSIISNTMNEYPEMASLVKDVSIPEDLRPANGDERQLQQAFVYLLRNAKKAKGEVCITAENIYLHEGNEFLLKGGDYIRIFFSDKSRSIPRAQLEKIFEPSFSVSALSSRSAQGLELAICHSIIKKHQGHIAAASQPGKGSVFDIILPAYNEQKTH